MLFGELFKQLRTKKGISIKKIAPELGVDYTYISKLENLKINPSEKFIKKISDYFDYNVDEMMVLAGKVPEDIEEILKGNPKEAIAYLRRRFGKNGKR